MGSTNSLKVFVAYLGLCVLFVSSDASTKPHVRWSKCPDSSPLAPSTVECGHIDVPMNHDDPSGQKITLALTRLKANGSRKACSGLFLEKGGPGAANTGTVFKFAVNEANGTSNGPASDAIRQTYDQIGVDMRGTGFSTPSVKCDGQLYDALMFPPIKDEATYNATTRRARAWGQSCVDMTGSLISHMGTDQAVQDFELVRRALSYDKFNYLGFSYGTKIGYDYAQKYPHTVGRMVLDGLTNQQMPMEDMWTATALGLDATFNDFFRWCNQTLECALHGQDQRHIFDTVAGWARNRELRNATCLQQECDEGSKNSTLDDAHFIFGAELQLHDGVLPHKPQNWQNAAIALNATFFEKTDAHYQDLTWNKRDPSDLQTSFNEFVIQCSDGHQRQLSVSDFGNINTLLEAIAPISRGNSVQSRINDICAGWPLPARNPPKQDLCQMRKLPPVMLVSAFFDPVTTSSLGIGLRAQMPTAFSVYRNGGGHLSFPHQGETAMAVARFLINGTIPKDGTTYQT